ncbi:hypothetical protein GCM10020295_66380 [Streptomyces cinereospinus]
MHRARKPLQGVEVHPLPGERHHEPVPDPTTLRRAPVQRRSAERLTRILDACADLLDEVGYDALSTRAVAERAGVPIGSVYRFFGNKRQMADALAQRNLERYAERVTERLRAGGGGDWRTAMDAVLDEYLAMKRTTPGFSLVDFGNQIPVGSRRAEPNHRVADRLTDLLGDHLPRTPRRRTAPRLPDRRGDRGHAGATRLPGGPGRGRGDRRRDAGDAAGVPGAGAGLTGRALRPGVLRLLLARRRLVDAVGGDLTSSHRRPWWEFKGER